MKTWMKRTLIAVTGATIVLGTLSACGHRGDHLQSGWSEQRIIEMRGKAIERVSSKLELNAEQKQKLGLLADEIIEAMANFYESLTPAQQTQVREVMNKRRGWRRG